ncbi:succinate dehydrogenase assembly factor 2-A, mitochondrial [Calliphora vicina]|uniref:succinate dehydrogenase assembly factor 2-A, mitochondrial n=1 Tax=Calliphora vicina TaxID=7373 RepID=UPI00325C033A
MLRQILTNVYQKSLIPAVARTQRFSAAAGGDGGKQKDIINNADVPIIDYEDPDYLPLPEYPFKTNEPLDVKKQRLVYQSRKRGMLENDLLLSTFIDKFLKGMDAKLTEQYDQLINGVTNDWEIYYWATQTKPTPPEYDNEIMKMLKEHVANAQREKRLRQPNL